MSIEDLKKDQVELTKFLGEATRFRVKEILTTAKAEVDREIINLELKAKQIAENNASGVLAKHKRCRYLIELNEYAWDQSEKFVKLFITLEGVQNLDESNVKIIFTESSMQLHVIDLNDRDYGLTVNNLLYPIDVEKSYRKIKSGMISVYMKKSKEGQPWDHLTTIQKRLKEKQDNDFKADPDNAEDALVNIMKKMYNSGDAKTKQMIAKAWTESHEKVRMGGNPMEI